jgi:putative SOS response-associated peptidase YedK
LRSAVLDGPWTGERRGERREHLLYSFLTCESNDVVRPIHAEAMPVIVTSEEEREAWLTAPVEEALKLPRPLPNEALRVVASGEKEDEIAA